MFFNIRERVTRRFAPADGTHWQIAVSLADYLDDGLTLGTDESFQVIQGVSKQ